MSTFRLKRTLVAIAFASATSLTLSGCWGGDDSGPATFSLGGIVTGLTTDGLVLIDGTDTTSVAAGATSFAFPTGLPAGATYSVGVQAQPANATCVVSGGSGTVGTTAVAGVSVTCRPTGFTVGGAISGLTAAGLVLANGNDTVAVASGATGFTLPTRVANGGTYTVTVRTQPSGEQCSLTNSTGTIAGANVTNVAVACAAVSHSLGGTIAGLSSAGLVLANGSDTVSPAAGALAFTFPTPVAEGGAYAVNVRTQPTGATCSVGSGTGTMGTADVASVQVTCSANAYKVGGTISGLTAGGLVLTNGTDSVSPAANATTFQFAQRVAFGGSYSVRVQQQPTGLTCSVAGTYPATMGPGDVSDIAVSCAVAGALTTLAGGTCSAAGPEAVPGTGAAASVPLGFMSFDPAGNLFIAGANVVVKVTPAGVVSILAGKEGTFGHTDGNGAAATFGFMSGIVSDSAGNVFVSDQLAIRRITPAGVVTTLAGSATDIGFVNGIGSAARFNNPSALATDSVGNVYVADISNNAIRSITPAGVVTTYAGTGTQGAVDGPAATAQFFAPEGLAFNAAGELLVADVGNNSIRKISAAGVVSTLAGLSGSRGYLDATGSAARFASPQSMSLDAGGNLYATDQNGLALRKITAAGVVTTVAKVSAFPLGPAGILVVPSPFAQPWAVNSSGQIYVGVGCSIQKTGP